jgi:HNH endonuclease
MSRRISPTLRLTVAVRANYCCEYCRLPELAVMLRFQIEHIISIQHGGKTVLSNLAFSCPICNSRKGPNIGTVLDDDETFIRFFHPRKHDWHEHFEIQNGQILPKTQIGEGTAKILNFNELDLVLERIELMETGFYK